MGYPVSVLAKLHEVMRKVKRIDKTVNVKGAGGGYMAIGWDHTLATIRGQFVKHGLMLNVMCVEGSSHLDTGMATKGGARIIFFEGTWDVIVSCVDTGEMIVSRQINSDMDSAGMAATKAETKALKKALLTMLMLGAGENEEEREEQAAEKITAEQRTGLLELCDTLGLDRGWLESLAIAKGWESSEKIPALGYDYAVRRLRDKAEDVVAKPEKETEEPKAKTKQA